MCVGILELERQRKGDRCGHLLNDNAILFSVSKQLLDNHHQYYHYLHRKYFRCKDSILEYFYSMIQYRIEQDEQHGKAVLVGFKPFLELKMSRSSSLLLSALEFGIYETRLTGPEL